MHEGGSASSQGLLPVRLTAVIVRPTRDHIELVLHSLWFIVFYQTSPTF